MHEKANKKFAYVGNLNSLQIAFEYLKKTKKQKK